MPIEESGSAPQTNSSEGTPVGEEVHKKGKLTLFTSESRKKIRRRSFKFPIITAQALRDIFTLRRIVAYLIILCIVPAITAMLVPSNISSYPLEMQIVKLTDYMFSLGFLWIGGIPLVFMCAGTMSSMINSEITEGTLLQLITRPVRRWEVIIGKFLAFFILFAFVEILAFLLSAYLLIYFSGAHLSVFVSMLAFLPPLIIYSFLVAVFFGSISLVLSTVIRKNAFTIVIVAFLVMLFYIGFLFFRLLGAKYYQDYYLYYIDIGYLLGNVYIMLLNAFSINLSPNFQLIFGFTAGTFDPAAFMDTYDFDQGFRLTALPVNDFVSGGVSLLICLFLPAGLILLAIMRVKKMEVG